MSIGRKLQAVSKGVQHWFTRFFIWFGISLGDWQVLAKSYFMKVMIYQILVHSDTVMQSITWESNQKHGYRLKETWNWITLLSCFHLAMIRKRSAKDYSVFFAGSLQSIQAHLFLVKFTPPKFNIHTKKWWFGKGNVLISFKFKYSYVCSVAKLFFFGTNQFSW